LSETGDFVRVARGERCRGCDGRGMSVFYEQQDVPVHSVLLMPSREAALEYPRGDIVLGFCQACGFVSNLAFDPSRLEYSPRYEETQEFSATFNAFHRDLAEHLISRYDLHGKHIVEIGCGKGEFLDLLCRLGPNTGTGFDPAWVEGRREPLPGVEFIRDFYSEEYAGRDADFVCCKMTLEHIRDVAEFVGLVRAGAGDRTQTTVFFQVPNLRYILREQAFWDIYYEHCSYFTAGSLARLFYAAGFDVVDSWTAYDDQYLMLEARVGAEAHLGNAPPTDSVEELTKDVEAFRAGADRRRQAWRQELHRSAQAGQRVVLWGAGSKGVAFLTRLGVGTAIEFCVDVNPHKHGTYMPGTGHEIVSPERLRERPPDVVIVMNPVYREEIGGELERMGLAPRILTVDEVS
jgi:SAM-dependent methyltransferase